MSGHETIGRLRRKLSASSVYMTALTPAEWAEFRDAIVETGGNVADGESWCGARYVIPSAEYFSARVDGDRRVVTVDGEDVEMYPSGGRSLSSVEADRVFGHLPKAKTMTDRQCEAVMATTQRQR